MVITIDRERGSIRALRETQKGGELPLMTIARAIGGGSMGAHNRPGPQWARLGRGVSAALGLAHIRPMGLHRRRSSP